MPRIYRFARLATCAAALLAAAPAALAQVGLGNPALDFPGLSRPARASLHAAVAKLYEAPAVGAVKLWASPDGTASGRVKLLRSFEYSTAEYPNMPCRRIDYTIRTKGYLHAGHYVVTWCRIPAGEWKIVEVPG